MPAQARTLADLLNGFLGLQARPRTNPEGSSLGTAVARVLGNNPNRVGFLFINLSTVNMYLAPLDVPTTTKAIIVGPGGGNLSAVWLEDFDLCGYEWNGLADAVASNYLAIEYVTQP